MISFSNKKYAKQFAAKKAIDWLIENRCMPRDVSVKFPKAPQPPPPAKILPTASQSESRSATTYAAQVPDLCHQLGFNVPKYEIHPVMENTSLYDAYADFGVDGAIVFVTATHRCDIARAGRPCPTRLENGHNLLISDATYPAPKPLSIFTTLTFEAQEFIIPSSAAMP